MKRTRRYLGWVGLLVVGYDIGFATCEWLTREAKKR